jgi:hypothetical protein
MMTPHSKKAQITIFVILGIILVVGVIFFVAMQKKDSAEDIFRDQEFAGTVVSNIARYSNQCFDNVVEDSIRDVLLQGGYYNLSLVSHDVIGTFSVPYYLEDDLKIIPSEDEIYEAIRLMIIKNFDACVGDYEAFEEFDVVLEKQETNLDMEIDEGLLINLNPHLIVSFQQSEYSSDVLSRFVPLNIEPLLLSANQIVESHIGFDAGYLSLTRVSSAVNDHGVVFDALSYGDNALLLLKNDEASDYVLMFLMDLN